jgi:hypothetical protein
VPALAGVLTKPYRKMRYFEGEVMATVSDTKLGIADFPHPQVTTLTLEPGTSASRLWERWSGRSIRATALPCSWCAISLRRRGEAAAAAVRVLLVTARSLPDLRGRPFPPRRTPRIPVRPR